jgi:hypothetical protein
MMGTARTRTTAQLSTSTFAPSIRPGTKLPTWESDTYAGVSWGDVNNELELQYLVTYNNLRRYTQKIHIMKSTMDETCSVPLNNAFFLRMVEETQS